MNRALDSPQRFTGELETLARVIFGFLLVRHGMEAPILNGFLFLFFRAAGPGAWSLDGWLFRRSLRSMARRSR